MRKFNLDSKYTQFYYYVAILNFGVLGASLYSSYVSFSKNAPLTLYISSLLQLIMVMATACAVVVIGNDIKNRDNTAKNIDDFKKLEDKLLRLNQKLESKVEKRTIDLQSINDQLSDEIRERKLMESLLAHHVKIADEARERAEDANRIKSEFLANMSHELRTPLNAIIGYSEILEEDAEEDGQVDLIRDLQKIRNAGKHLLNLINDVLDLAKIESGKMSLYFESFDITKLAEDVINTVQPVCSKNNNKITLSCAKDVGLMRSDLTKVQQSLFNLLSNASKFTHAGHIQLSITKEVNDAGEKIISFKVSDTGIGIKPDQLKKLFRAFSQADNSTTRKYGGTGLGLAITKQFTTMMNGEILVESEYGKGSTFTLNLPQIAQQFEDDITSSFEENVTPSGIFNPHYTKTVLVIDDNHNDRRFLHRYLTGEGYNVALATNGQQGLQMALEILPDLITLDVMMPEMDGWETLVRLKNNPKLANIPVVMSSIIEDRHLAQTLGAADYLVKPVEKQRLVNVLDKHIGRDEQGCILVVEDDEASREMMCRMLVQEGWTVQSAANGLKAIDCIQAEQPLIILLDLMMPEMDGFEVIKTVSQNPNWHKIPIIVVTAMDLNTVEHGLLTAQVTNIFQKGKYNKQQLITEVQSLIEQSNYLTI
jgi:signal transduction histidine kinase/DNA-binding response OmpR family regulator